MQPGSNTPGALPREVLLGSERVVFETHPGARRLHPAMFWVPIPIAIFFALVLAAGAVGAGPGAIPVLVFGGFVLVLPFVVLTFRAVWLARKTAYGLTDQRVILSVGEEAVSVQYAQLSGIQLSKRSSIVFSVRPDTPVPPSSLMQHNPPALIWKAVPGAPTVATYARSAAEYYSLRQQQAQIRQELIKSSMEDKVFCEYCGGFTTLSQIDSSNPRCPRCSAPIVVAPLGIH